MGLQHSGLHSTALTGVLVTAWGAGIYCQTSPQQHRLIAVAPGEPALVIGLNSSAIYAGIGLGTVLGGLILPAGVAAADDQDPCGRTSPESYAATAA